MDQNAREKLLLKYEAPPWMQNLTNLPTHRIKASMTDTPIERWHLPDVPDGYEVYIKREDLTGCSLSGNKVRGFEFLFGDVIRQGCSTICSCGPVQSNMNRTLALMAASLGIKTHLIIYCADKDEDAGGGNNLLVRVAGAHQYIVPNSNGVEAIRPKMKLMAEKIRKETGEKVYTYTVGQNPYVFGYFPVFDELMRQGVESFSDIVIASVGAKSTFGLAVGNHLNGYNIKIHSVVTGEYEAYAVNELNKMLRYVGMQQSDGSGVNAQDICHVTEHLGGGHGETTPEELDFLKRVAAKTGVILGSAYSGKAAYHLVKQLNEQPEQFKGKKILFVHTGGIFDLFDGRMQKTFANDENVRQWNDFIGEESASYSSCKRRQWKYLIYESSAPCVLISDNGKTSLLRTVPGMGQCVLSDNGKTSLMRTVPGIGQCVLSDNILH